MKYKVGDKVRVRKDLEPGNYYGKGNYISSMDKFKGKICVITKIWDQYYQINNSDYWWSEEMLESIGGDEKLLEYALEKLGMTKEELEYEMNEDKKDIKFIEKCIKDNEKRKEYCKKFDSDCNGCEVRRFKDKYEKYGYIPCDDVYKYLKEKGEI